MLRVRAFWRTGSTRPSAGLACCNDTRRSWGGYRSQESYRMYGANSKLEATTDACEAPGMIVSPNEDNRCEFEATLLAMAGHDLRQPLQVLQNVQARLNDGLRTSAELRLLKMSQTAI